jgi:hypothetical protein
MKTVKYTLSNSIQSGYDIDVRTEDGGVATIRYNGEHYVTEYYHTRDKGTTINWEKLAEGKLYTKDWNKKTTSINISMIEDALAWLHVATGPIEFKEINILNNASACLNKNTPLDKILITSASVVDNKYYYLPYWFEKDGDEFIMHHMENLPPELVTAVNTLRNE